MQWNRGFFFFEIHRLFSKDTVNQRERPQWFSSFLGFFFFHICCQIDNNLTEIKLVNQQSCVESKWGKPNRHKMKVKKQTFYSFYNCFFFVVIFVVAHLTHSLAFTCNPLKLSAVNRQCLYIVIDNIYHILMASDVFYWWERLQVLC